jgi:hypothetical protein
VAKGNSVFIALLEHLIEQNVSLIEFKKDLATKRLKVKAEIEAIPTRIDEASRSLPLAKNWQSIRQEMQIAENRIFQINESISDRSKAAARSFAKKQAVLNHKSSLLTRRAEIEFSYKSEALNEVNKAKNALTNVIYEIDRTQNSKNNLLALNSNLNVNISKLEEKLVTLRTEWKKINGETLSFGEYDFACPACGREFEGDAYEEIRLALLANFNSHKAKRLKENESSGRNISKNEINNLIVEREGNIQKIEQLETKLQDLKVTRIGLEDAIPVGQPNITKLLEAQEYISICAEIEAITIPEQSQNTDIKVLQEEVKEILGEIDGYKKVLNEEILIVMINERIAQLRNDLIIQAQVQADLEKMQFTIAEFEKAKIDSIESKINGMFRFVKFKMFEQQINGGEVPTCVCMVNGVPYPDLNNAMRINAGMDIIATLSRAKDVYAPIFCDNAESVNELIPMDSQIIRLVVTNDKSLMIA